MARKLFVLVAACAAVLLPGGAAGQITVGPLVRMMETTDGRGSIGITVRNETEDRLEIGVVVSDWEVDSLGNHSFRPAGTLPESCGVRLRTDTRELTLGARAAGTVVVRYDAADDVASRCRNIIFFRVGGAADELGGDQLIISTGVKIYVGPGAG